VTRFLSVGVFNTLFDIAILNTLVFLFSAPVVAANLVSATISMTASYFLNHHIVFRSKESHSFKKFIHFFLVTGVGILGIQSLVIYGVTHLLQHQQSFVDGLTHTLSLGHLSNEALEVNVAKILAVLVAMVWNFTIYHFVIFKKQDGELDEDVLL
jgi:putative flippase GtrA